MRVLLVAFAVLLALPATAHALPPFTTTAKTSPGGTAQAVLHAPAVGCHSRFDRFVIRARVGTPRYDVRYVRRIVQDGSGNPVSLLGRHRLRVLFPNARGHTSNGTTDLIANVITPRCPNLRQIKDAGDFEGVVTLGIGLRERTGFRVFRLTNPTRVVIDVAH
jgi:hypothetical protein